MSLEFAGLGGLFLAAFIAATLFPASSEAVLGGMVASGAYDPWLLIAIASTANILGAIVNWALGRWASTTRCVQDNRHLAHAFAWFRRFGPWSLLLSWMPVIGDPLTMAAGLARLSFVKFVVPVAIGKIARYLAVFHLADWLAGT